MTCEFSGTVRYHSKLTKKYIYDMLQLKEFKQRGKKRESGKNIHMMVYFRCKANVYVKYIRGKTTYIL